MSRFIFQTPVVNRDGLYHFMPLSPEQARAWLNAGPDPVFRMPLIGSVIFALTGKELQVRPRERLVMHTGDEAMIVLFRFPENEGQAGYDRGHVAAGVRRLDEADLRDHIKLGLLQKFARFDNATKAAAQVDLALCSDRKRRFLAHDAALVEFGTYQFARCDLAQAQAWFAEGSYATQLRYDGACQALSLLTGRDISLRKKDDPASLSMLPGDQALTARFYYPDGYRPAPFEPYPVQLTLDYARAHTTLCLLTRLSDAFVATNAHAFPAAVRVPGEGAPVR